MRSGRDARPAARRHRRAARRPAGCSAASASIESAAATSCSVDALTADDVGGDAELELTEYARALVPPLPFAEIDVLIIEHGGKDISGTTLDPNVTGRFWVHGLADPESPDVCRRSCCSASPRSAAGNVLGIGFADFIPASVANQIDWQKTYVNCFTAGPAACAAVADADGAARRGGVHQGRAWRCAAVASTSPSASCASRRRCT